MKGDFLMIIGIDPGHVKIGIAFTEGDELLFSAIVPVEKKENLFQSLREGDFNFLGEYTCEGDLSSVLGREPEVICLGNGTGHKEFARELALPVRLVNEKYSSMEARREYFRLHKPRFWQWLLPRGFWLPPRDIDDLAAFVIAKRADIGEGEIHYEF